MPICSWVRTEIFLSAFALAWSTTADPRSASNSVTKTDHVSKPVIIIT